MPTIEEVERDKHLLSLIFQKHGVDNISIGAHRVTSDPDFSTEEEIWNEMQLDQLNTGDSIWLPDFFDDTRELPTTSDNHLALMPSRALTYDEWIKVENDIQTLHESPDGSCTLEIAVETDLISHKIIMYGLQDYGPAP